MIHEQPAPNATKTLASYLEARTGQQIAPSRYWRIQSALAPVIKEFGIPDLDALVAVLADGNHEGLYQQSLEAMLNNESFFFRDTAMFTSLKQQAFGRLRERRMQSKTLRIWSAGCSTGQEAYSLAMMLLDDKAMWADWKIEIIGTDISQSAINQAKSGIYSQFEIQRGLPVDMMLRFFDQQGSHWHINAEVKNMVQFRQDNLLRPATAMSSYDLILCRNVLMYFGPETRHMAYSRLGKSIADDGLFMMGAAETVVGHTDLFRVIAGSRGLYELSSKLAAGPFAA